jgi:hypothetical protein
MLVTTLILTAYLVITIAKNLPVISRSIADSQMTIIPLQQQLDKQQIVLEALQAELAGFHKEVNERIFKEEKHKEAIKSVQSALSKIEEAEGLRKSGDLTKAQAILLATKEPLWKAGDFFISDQARFRGLMALIDAALGAWQKGNGSVDVSKITASLKPVLEKISREQ